MKQELAFIDNDKKKIRCDTVGGMCEFRLINDECKRVKPQMQIKAECG